MSEGGSATLKLKLSQESQFKHLHTMQLRSNQAVLMGKRTVHGSRKKKEKKKKRKKIQDLFLFHKISSSTTPAACFADLFSIQCVRVS